MNTLEIKINPFKQINTASVNGKALSPYSELSNYLKTPLLKWANKLMEATENEINDEFNIEITADKFSQYLISKFAEKFELCKKITCKDFEAKISEQSRIKELEEIAKKYKININKKSIYTPIYGANNSKNPYLKKSDINDSEICFLDEIKQAEKAKILVVRSEDEDVTFENNQYLLKVNDSNWDDLENNLIVHFCLFPYINLLYSEISKKLSSLTDEDKLILNKNTDITGTLTVTKINTIEVNETKQIRIEGLKENSDVRIVAADSDILEVQESRIKGIKSGTTYLTYYRKDEFVPFDKHEIQVIFCNYANKIQISLESTRMGVDYSQEIGIKIFPDDAQDKDQLKLLSSNEEIASIKDGKIITHKPGKIKITAELERTSDSIELQVLPELESINLSIDKEKLYVGETEEIKIAYEPLEPYNNNLIWSSSKKDVAIVTDTDNHKKCVKATGIGTATIECKAEDGDAKDSFEIKVESTFKKKEKADLSKVLCWILAIGNIVLFFIFPQRILNLLLSFCFIAIIVLLLNKKKIPLSFGIFIIVIISAIAVLSIMSFFG